MIGLNKRFRLLESHPVTPLSLLCKPEVTGSIPVRSTGGNGVLASVSMENRRARPTALTLFMSASDEWSPVRCGP
jgi:hypothetical protein